MIIIEEAGGLITDYNGHSIEITKPCDILASNKMIHQKLRDSITL